ncbi:unnamed protein product, partial [marine sediment metagenome]
NRNKMPVFPYRSYGPHHIKRKDYLQLVIFIL